MNFENIKPDPSKSSILENMVNLELVQSIEREHLHNAISGEKAPPLNIYKDSRTGEIFCEILNSRHPRVQKLTSLIIKGAINGADIIENEGRYYSHVQESENIKDNSPDIRKELVADINLLYLLLNSTDHDLDNRHGVIKSHSGWKELHNVFIDDVGGKVYYFDFEKVSDIYRYHDQPEQYAYDGYHDSFEDLAAHEFKTTVYGNDNTKLEMIKQKITKILDTSLSDIETFKKIIQKSGVQLDNEDFKNFEFKGASKNERIIELFHEFKFRAEKVLEAVTKVIETKST